MAIFLDMLMMGILLASLAVWGIVIERLMAGDPVIHCNRPVTRPRPWIATASVYAWTTLSLYHVITAGDQAKIPQLKLDQAMSVALRNILDQAVITCIMVLTLTGLGIRSLTQFGIDLRHSSSRLAWGLTGYLAAVIPVLLVSFAMQAFRQPENLHPYLQLLDQQDSWQFLSLLVVSAVIMAPLSEELMYRVIFQGALQRWTSPWLAIVGSSLVFAGVHGFPDAVSLLPLAIILGFLYWRTGSYVVVVTAHASFNAVNLMMAVMKPGE